MANLFKRQNTTSKLNVTSSINLKANNETLNIGGPGVSNDKLAMVNLVNANLFYDGSLATRYGSTSLSNGLIGNTFQTQLLLDIERPNILIGNDGFTNIPLASAFDYPFSIYIPSGTQALTSGTFTIRGADTFDPGPGSVRVKSYLFALDQAPIRALGPGFMSGNNTLHNIALSGNYNVPPYPGLLDQSIPIPQGATPIAISENIVNFDTYGLDPFTGLYQSSGVLVNWQFSSPAYLNSGVVYGIRYLYETIADQRSVQIEYSFYPGPEDIAPNNRLVQEFFYIGPPAPGFQNYALREFAFQGLGVTEKFYIKGETFGYLTPGFLNFDDYSSDKVLINPIKNSKTPYGPQWYSDLFASTETANMGQVFTPVSGEYVYYGAYFYPAAVQEFTDGYPIRPTSIGPINTPGLNNIGLKTRLSKIITSSGALNSGNYFTSNVLPIASGTGSFVFDFSNPNQYEYPAGISPAIFPSLKPNYRENKNYILFDNPIEINTSGTDQYLIDFGYYNLDDGTNFNTYQLVPEFSTFGDTTISSWMGMGVQGNNVFNGGLVVNNSGNMWSQFSGTRQGSVPVLPTPSLAPYDLNCGMIRLQPDSAITLIYDYRAGNNNNNQQILYGQRDKLYWSTFENPQEKNWTVIHSGAVVDQNALWSTSTLQSLAFMHQYGLSKGQVWTSSVSGVLYSGLTYDHGHRPQILNGISSVIASGSTLASGNYNLMIATSMDSGGFRSSTISGITINSGTWVEVNFGAINQQFPFDVNTDQTFVFMTAVSGNVFYTPTLYAGPSSGIPLAQPIDNNVGTVYINTPININVDNTVPEALNPPYPEYYLTTQIDTPEFKKTIAYYNYLIGIGASGVPSKVYYSEINAPQIWGTAGDFHGSFDINPQDGDIITSLERFKQYLIVFKSNSTYRMEFVNQGAQPFQSTPIDNTIGNLGTFSTVSTQLGVYGLSQFGPILCDGNSVQTIGQEIYPWYATLNHNDLIFSYVVHDQVNNIITWSIGNDDINPSRNFGLVFNYRNNSWIIRQGLMWNCAAIVRDQNNFDQIWVGDSLGQVKRDGVTSSDTDLVLNDGNGVTQTDLIQLVAETSWMSFVDSSLKKLFRFVSFNNEAAPGSFLNIDVFFDYETIPRYTRTIDISLANNNNRINLGGYGKTVKFNFYNTGLNNFIKINKINVEYQYIGQEDPSSKTNVQ